MQVLCLFWHWPHGEDEERKGGGKGQEEEEDEKDDEEAKIGKLRNYLRPQPDFRAASS